MPNRRPGQESNQASGAASVSLMARWGLACAVLALACGESSLSQLDALVRASFPGVPQMSLEEFEQRLGEEPPPLVVDVREPDEYETSHLPGAVHAQGEDVADLLEAAAPDRTIVLYCSVGYRSSAAVADLIQRHGELVRGRVWNLEGSIFAWANSGRPVFRGDREVGKVHPFDERWGRLLSPELRP